MGQVHCEFSDIRSSGMAVKWMFDSSVCASVVFVTADLGWTKAQVGYGAVSVVGIKSRTH